MDQRSQKGWPEPWSGVKETQVLLFDGVSSSSRMGHLAIPLSEDNHSDFRHHHGWEISDFYGSAQHFKYSFLSNPKLQGNVSYHPRSQKCMLTV